MSPSADSSSSSDDEVEDITYDDGNDDATPSQPTSWGGNNWSPYDDPGLLGSVPPTNYDDESDENSDDDEPRLW